MAKILDFERANPSSHALSMEAWAWFRRYQPFLLWMANWSKDGMELLRMDQTDLTRIDEIAPNYVKQVISNNLDGTQTIKADFRVGAKWANLINYQWEATMELYRYWVRNVAPLEAKARRKAGLPWEMPVLAFGPGAAGTYYPQAGSGGANVSFDAEYGRLADLSDWSAINTAASATSTDSTASTAELVNWSCSATANKWYRLYRTGQTIDTSSIGASSTVSSATFSVYGVSKINPVNWSLLINLFSFSPALNNAASAGDYSARGTTELCDTGKSYASWSTTGYNDFSLNAAGIASIDVSGITKNCIRETAYEVPNSSPTYSANAQGYIRGRSADQTGTSNDPKLVVEYSAASSFIPKVLTII